MKYRHGTQVLSTIVVSKMSVSKIIEIPLTVRRFLVYFHGDESERTWGTMLALDCIYRHLLTSIAPTSYSRRFAVSHVNSMAGSWSIIFLGHISLGDERRCDDKKKKNRMTNSNYFCIPTHLIDLNGS